MDAMLGIIVDDGLYPGDKQASESWPFHRPGERGLLNAVCSKFYDASAVVGLAHKPPLLWLRGQDDPVISDAGEEDPAVIAAVNGDLAWPGVHVYPPQPMIAQMAHFVAAYREAGGDASSAVVPGAHLPWISDPKAFDQVWHPWIGARHEGAT